MGANLDIDDVVAGHPRAQAELDRLRARATYLKTALGQYADKNNWGYYDDSGCDKGHGRFTDACFIGPELARAAIAEEGE